MTVVAQDYPPNYTSNNMCEIWSYGRGWGWGNITHQWHTGTEPCLPVGPDPQLHQFPRRCGREHWGCCPSDQTGPWVVGSRTKTFCHKGPVWWLLPPPLSYQVRTHNIVSNASHPFLKAPPPPPPPPLRNRPFREVVPSKATSTSLGVQRASR